MLFFVESKSDIPGHKFLTYFHFKGCRKENILICLVFIGKTYVSQSTFDDENSRHVLSLR